MALELLSRRSICRTSRVISAENPCGARCRSCSQALDSNAPPATAKGLLTLAGRSFRSYPRVSLVVSPDPPRVAAAILATAFTAAALAGTAHATHTTAWKAPTPARRFPACSRAPAARPQPHRRGRCRCPASVLGVEPVGARVAVEDVAAGAAAQAVVALAPAQVVVAGPAVDHVVSAVGVDDVVA